MAFLQSAFAAANPFHLQKPLFSAAPGVVWQLPQLPLLRV
jgi:hypothetical protein